MIVNLTIMGETAELLKDLNRIKPEVRLTIALGGERLETEQVGKIISAKIINTQGLIVDIELEVELNA